jgi:hypothetical protein
VDIAEFKTFAAMMLGFVQEVFHDTWNVKDQIRSASTIERVGELLAAFKGKYAV